MNKNSNNKSASVTVRIPHDQMKLIVKRAKREGHTSKGRIIKDIINAALTKEATV